jgi:hypothetical protein
VPSQLRSRVRTAGWLRVIALVLGTPPGSDEDTLSFFQVKADQVCKAGATAGRAALSAVAGEIQKIDHPRISASLVRQTTAAMKALGSTSSGSTDRFALARARARVGLMRLNLFSCAPFVS